jgi:catechol 2,3-dioxygenase-like lactoylglutathione lyase family enzyme
MIRGINHVTFAVRDLERAFAFYTGVLGLRPVARWPKGAYLLAGDLWVALVADRNADGSSSPDYSHVAFTVEPADFEALALHVRESGAEIWRENRSEGASLYFTDPDGHRLELHASGLAERLADMRRREANGVRFYDGAGDEA